MEHLHSGGALSSRSWGAGKRETMGTRLVCELHFKWFELNRHKGGEGERCEGKISSLLPDGGSS